MTSRRVADGNRTRAGFTLVEMIIAMGITVLVMGAVAYMYRQSREQFEKPRASFSLQDDLVHLTAWLQSDLSESDLSTVRSYPNSKYASEAPGLSLESPRQMTDDASSAVSADALTTTPTGGVAWQKYVYYTLVPVDDPVQGSNVVGNVVRKEGLLTTDQTDPLDAAWAFPVASPKLPSQAGTVASTRVVAHDVVLPGTSVAAQMGLDAAGGFKVTALQDGSPQPLSGTLLPEQPVSVTLWVREISTATGKVSTLSVQLQILPRN